MSDPAGGAGSERVDTEQLFGPYRLERLLGRGGMGEVFRAFDTGQNRVVALKRLLPSSARTDDAARRFRREAEMVARLREPHVIPIHSYGEIDGRLYIDMRLVEGRDLGQVIAEDHRLSAGRAVEIIAQVAAALDAAHADGLVHRDVKPSNVLITPDGFAYLVDFGIAQALGADYTALTETGMAIGTWAYMAPERFRGGESDHRVEVYALACILYETLAGQRPFVCTDAASAIGAHLHQQPAQARPPGASRRRWRWWLPPLVLVVVLVAVLRYAAPKSPEHTIPVGNTPEAVAISPDGARAYVANSESSTISVVDLARSAVTATVTLAESPHDLALTPDGRSLVVASQRGGPVLVIDTTTDTVLGPVEATMNASTLAMEPSGTALAATGDRILLINPVTRAVVGGVLGDFIGVGGMAVDEEGGQGGLIYMTDSLHHDVRVLDSGAGAVTGTFQVGNNPEGLALSPDHRFLYTANSLSNDVSVVDAVTGNPVATIPIASPTKGLPFAPRGLPFAPRGLPFAPRVILVSPDGTCGYVGGTTGITVLNLTRNVVDDQRGNSFVGGLALTPDGRTLLATDGVSNALLTSRSAERAH